MKNDKAKSPKDKDVKKFENWQENLYFNKTYVIFTLV